MDGLAPQSSRDEEISVADSGTTPKLCQRCESLSISVSTQGFDGSAGRPLTTLAANTLKAGCALCTQFCIIFERLSSLTGVTEKTIYIWLLLYSSRLPPTRIKALKIWLLGPSEKRSRIQFLPMRNSLPGDIPFSRSVCPNVPDYQFVRTQLDYCRRFHGHACARSTNNTHIMRVIDCKSRRLVELSPDDSYTCLSYVWGKNSVPATHGFKNELPAHVPKTVEDAMAVTTALGVPYLWVDRYCIDQGNPQEKHSIIRNMNKVYEGADFTIIAAAGDDPSYGLPGVRGTPRTLQLTLSLGGLDFVSVEDISHEVNRSTWASRGWTYQEMLLSRRRLVFTNSQMYFQCRTMHGMEGLHPTFPASGYALEDQFQCFPSEGIGRTFDDLQRRLEEYFPRQLSFHTDVISAFDGIFSAFDELENFRFRVTQFYGVPVMYNDHTSHLARKSFITYLCWSVSIREPEGKVGLNMFPSWSWASAKVNYPQGRLSGYAYYFYLIARWQHDDVEVCFTHKTDGDMDLDNFVKHKDSYNMFLPSIKMTTWTLEFPFQWTPGHKLKLLGNDFGLSLPPEKSCQRLHLCYLGVPPSILASKIIFALALAEIQPGVFRRVGLWSEGIEFELDTCNSAHDMLANMLEQIREDGDRQFPEPGEREALSQLEWKRRTVTIV